MFRAMTRRSIVDPGYKIALFLHVLAVVLAFGPTFGYALFFSVAPQHPRATPAILAGRAEVRQVPGQPGDGRPPARRPLPADASDDAWETSDAFIGVGFLAIIALFGLQHGFFSRRCARRRRSPNATSKAGDTLSDEFEALGQRIGQVGDARRDRSSS